MEFGRLGGRFDSIKIVPSSSSNYIYTLNSKKTQISITQSFKDISTGAFDIKAKGVYRISYSYSYVTGGSTQCVYNLNITSNGFSKTYENITNASSTISYDIEIPCAGTYNFVIAGKRNDTNSWTCTVSAGNLILGFDIQS